MITFIVCLTLLITAYFTYGRHLERVCDLNSQNPVPSQTCYDGVDYIPLPRWKIFLIQLLNIAGLGPIFGAVLGAAYGPIAFLWITLGGIFIGAMHDMIAGVISLKHNGMSLPEIVGEYLGNGTRRAMSVFSILLMVLVGAVFLSQPAKLIDFQLSIPTLEGIAFGNYSWLLLIIIAIILIYYITATMLPIDKVIGRFYPIFGLAMLVMAIGILVVLLTHSDQYVIPEFTSFENMIANAENLPIIPTLFTTIACGAISGFHATQSPMMARCMTNEKQCRSVFYGAMIAESIIALIWAAIAMAFWGNVEGLNEAIAQHGGNAAVLIDIIATECLHPAIAGIVIAGVVVCAITSGDTAFRSARLMVADMLHIDQKCIRKRFAISMVLFAQGLFIIFALPFQTIWSYFAWCNQTLAAVTLWTIVAYLIKNKKNMLIAAIPAIFMTFVCASYMFISPLMFGMENRTAAYVLGELTTIVIAFVIARYIRHNYGTQIKK